MLGGSVARGNDLSISDVDIWVYPRDYSVDLGLIKQHRDGVLLDVEQHHPSELRAVLGYDELEPYAAAFLRDAVILHDPDGEVAAAQLRYRRYLASDAFLEAVLPGLREPVGRNLDDFAEDCVRASDPLVAIRAPIFCLWSLVDLACVQRGVAPGGFGVLRRLRDSDPKAARGVEDALYRHWASIPLNMLAGVYADIAGDGAVGRRLLANVSWLAENGLLTDAWFLLWIAMGLRCKAAERGDLSDQQIEHVRDGAKRWAELLQITNMDRRQHLASTLLDTAKQYAPHSQEEAHARCVQAMEQAFGEEWRHLGFCWALSIPDKEWRVAGTREGLCRFADLLAGYARDDKRSNYGEHRRYPPFYLFSITTWPEAEITEDGIRGEPWDIGRLGRIARDSIRGTEWPMSVGKLYAPDSEFDLVLDMRGEAFDPEYPDDMPSRSTEESGESIGWRTVLIRLLLWFVLVGLTAALFIIGARWTTLTGEQVTNVVLIVFMGGSLALLLAPVRR